MAANFSEVGINFSVFNNLSFPDLINITNVTKQEFIESIPAIANQTTNGYYGIVVLVVLLIFITWMLSDISQFGLFRYSTIRSLGIALGIVLTFGIMMVAVGYMTSFIQLSILSVLYTIVLLYIYISNPG